MRLPDTPAGLAQIGGHEPIVCSECGKGFDGDRRAARAARWEPVSSASQHALDHGPMICLDCMRARLDRVLNNLEAAAKAGRLPEDHSEDDTDEREDGAAT